MCNIRHLFLDFNVLHSSSEEYLTLMILSSKTPSLTGLLKKGLM